MHIQHRHLIAFSCLAALGSGFCGAANAQNAVTIYGIVDTYVGSVRGTTQSTRVDEGGNVVSRLGFRGREDLGGGMDAHYTLEMGLSVDTGAVPLGGGFGRQAFVGVGDTWGTVDMGLQYTPMFFNLLETATFGMNTNWAPVQVITRTDSQGAGVAALAPPLRQANMLRYRSSGDARRSTGLSVDAAFAPGEGSTVSGNFWGAAVAYRGEGYFLGLSTQRIGTGSGAVTAGNTFAHALSAHKSFGATKVNFNYIVTGSTLPATNRAAHTVLGVEHSMGQHVLLAEVVRRNVQSSPNSAVISAIGYDYNLSKRTALYGRLLLVDNKARAGIAMGTAPVTANSGDDVRALAIGIKHSF